MENAAKKKQSQNQNPTQLFTKLNILQRHKLKHTTAAQLVNKTNKTKQNKSISKTTAAAASTDTNIQCQTKKKQ